jgi:hypothetical protein
VSRYGAEIEADLALGPGARGGGGWRLSELFTTAHWRFLLNLIDHLPRSSFFADAMAQDDELVERNRDAIPKAGAWRPAIAEWDTLHELVATLVDEVARLNTNFISVNSKKGHRPKPPKPYVRPQSALDRAKKKWGAEDVLGIVGAVTPHRADQVKRALGIDDE